MSLLERHLASRQIISSSDLEVALRRQQSAGGSLDTALLELGLLTPLQLDECLQAACGLPGAPVRLLERGPVRPWDHVPKDLLDIGWAIPLASEDGQVWVAVHPDLPDAKLGQMYRQVRGLYPVVAPECCLAKIAAERTGAILSPRYALVVLDYLHALRAREAGPAGAHEAAPPALRGLLSREPAGPAASRTAPVSPDMSNPAGPQAVPSDISPPPAESGAADASGRSAAAAAHPPAADAVSRGTSRPPAPDAVSRDTSRPPAPDAVSRDTSRPPAAGSASPVSHDISQPPAPAAPAGAISPVSGDISASPASSDVSPPAPASRDTSQPSAHAAAAGSATSDSGDTSQPSAHAAAAGSATSDSGDTSQPSATAGAASPVSHDTSRPSAPAGPVSPVSRDISSAAASSPEAASGDSSPASARSRPAPASRQPASPVSSDTSTTAGQRPAVSRKPAPTDSPRPAPTDAARVATATRPATIPPLTTSTAALPLAQRLQAARTTLATARERDRITEALVRAAALIAPRVGLFGVKREGLRVLAAPGSALRLTEGLVIPLPEGGPLDRVVTGQSLLHLLTEPSLSFAVGQPLGIPCVFDPVLAGGRTVLMLYLDRAGVAFDPAERAAVRELCDIARQSLEALLRLLGWVVPAAPSADPAAADRPVRPHLSPSVVRTPETAAASETAAAPETAAPEPAASEAAAAPSTPADADAPSRLSPRTDESGPRRSPFPGTLVARAPAEMLPPAPPPGQAPSALSDRPSEAGPATPTESAGETADEPPDSNRPGAPSEAREPGEASTGRARGASRSNRVRPVITLVNPIRRDEAAIAPLRPSSESIAAKRDLAESREADAPARPVGSDDAGEPAPRTALRGSVETDASATSSAAGSGAEPTAEPSASAARSDAEPATPSSSTARSDAEPAAPSSNAARIAAEQAAPSSSTARSDAEPAAELSSSAARIVEQAAPASSSAAPGDAEPAARTDASPTTSRTDETSAPPNPSEPSPADSALVARFAALAAADDEPDATRTRAGQSAPRTARPASRPEPAAPDRPLSRAASRPIAGLPVVDDEPADARENPAGLPVVDDEPAAPPTGVTRPPSRPAAAAAALSHEPPARSSMPAATGSEEHAPSDMTVPPDERPQATSPGAAAPQPAPASTLHMPALVGPAAAAPQPAPPASTLHMPNLVAPPGTRPPARRKANEPASEPVLVIPRSLRKQTELTATPHPMGRRSDREAEPGAGGPPTLSMPASLLNPRSGRRRGKHEPRPEGPPTLNMPRLVRDEGAPEADEPQAAAPSPAPETMTTATGAEAPVSSAMLDETAPATAAEPGAPTTAAEPGAPVEAAEPTPADTSAAAPTSATEPTPADTSAAAPTPPTEPTPADTSAAAPTPPADTAAPAETAPKTASGPAAAAEPAGSSVLAALAPDLREPVEVPPAAAAWSDEEVEAALEAYLADPADPAHMARLRTIDAAGLARIAARFPGPIDLANATSFPPPSAHGPLLRACVELGSVITPHILELFASARPQIRFYAAFLFQELRDARCLRALAELTLDSDPDVRLIATRVLESYNRSPEFAQAAARVRAELDGRDRERQLLATEAVSTLRDTLAVPRLIDLLAVRDKHLRETALEALCSITAKHHGYRAARWRSWYAEHGHEPRIVWVMDGLRHRDGAVRRWAADELVRLTGQRIPFPADADRRSRDLALRAWQDWWERHGEEFSAPR